ncbi:MAG: ATPase AAA [Patescibacteria group bacterium]|nr:MAG: ATPase AAA [Patescibacteria group bacterium]
MIKDYFFDFFKTYFKLLLFLPYFFSVNKLLFTLFYPWKKTSGFLNKKYKDKDLLSNLIFDLSSRSLGFVIRSTVLLIFSIVLFLVLLFFPVFFTLHLILFILYSIKELINPYSKRLLKLKKEFLKQRILQPENIKAGDDWFDIFLKHNHRYHHHYWLEFIFKLKPIAKDWDKGYTPTIEKYSQELTNNKFLSQLTEILDREDELNLLKTTLLKDYGGNTIILGESGVGKHSLVYALAKNIYDNECKNRLDDYRIFRLNLTEFLNYSSDMLQNTKLLKKIIYEAEYAGNIILFIEDLFDYIDNKLFNLNNIIYQLIQSNYVHIITILEPYAYLDLKQRFNNIDKTFQIVNLKPVSKTQAKEILLNKCFYYEQKYKVTFTYEAICSIIDKSDYLITDIPFPEKIFKLTDELISFVLKNKIKLIRPETITEFLKIKSDIPFNLTNEIKQKLLNIDKILNKKILYQQSAVSNISLALKKAVLNIGKNKKPLASFLLLGPTGVGKTHTAKTIAEIFFGSSDKLIRLDMNAVPSATYLLGDKKANIQSELELKLENNKYNVLLLDEFEKANREIQELFMTILDEGYLTTSFGKKLEFRFSFIIATSNALADQIDETVDKNAFIQKLIDAKIFSPELLNRFDDIILYKPLPKQIIIEIAKHKTQDLITSYEKKHNIKIKFDINQLDWDNIFSETNYKKFGAREVDRVISEIIESKIIDAILKKLNEAQPYNN